MNFLFLTTDQQRFDTIQCLGANHMLTPHLNWLVESGIRFLETRDHSRPFCLYLGFSKPHPPFDPPANYWALYQNTTVPDPVYGDWSADRENLPPGLMTPTWSSNGIDSWSIERIRDARRAYYALITQIDYQLGLLLGRLRELGELDNTTILFTSDHGEMLGDRLRRLLAAEMREHEFAGSGELVSIRECPTRASCRKKTWPGWHSADHTINDVLH